MADAPTQLSSVSWDTAAYNALAYYSLRPQLLFDQVADVRPTHQTHTGVSVTFTIAADLAAATSALSETADLEVVAMSDSTVTVTLVEYGNAVLTTAKLRLTSYVEVDPIVANVVGYNAGISVDTIVSNVLDGGTNVRYGSAGSSDPTSQTTIATEDTIAAADVAYCTAKLRGNNAPTFGSGYVGFIHPDVAYDFRAATGSLSWRDPHVYSDPSAIYQGEIGMIEGVRFIETPRAPLAVNASNGSGSTGNIDVYSTLVMGRQALAKAFAAREGYGPMPQVVLGPVVDRLRRFVPVGWRHFVGYAIFREACLYRIDSASSIGTNS
jgi:N4-gp56 family major capsid protein